MRHLRELYLRRNQIPTDLQELRYLSTLRNLRVLNLSENPISAEQGGLPCYRKVVLKHVPWLEKLDDVPVNYADVTSAQQLDLDQVCQMMNQCAIAEEIESTDSQPPGKEDKMPANFVSKTLKYSYWNFEKMVMTLIFLEDKGCTTYVAEAHHLIGQKKRRPKDCSEGERG